MEKKEKGKTTKLNDRGDGFFKKILITEAIMIPLIAIRIILLRIFYGVSGTNWVDFVTVVVVTLLVYAGVRTNLLCQQYKMELDGLRAENSVL